MTKMIALSGNTYPIKDKIKAAGGKWNYQLKLWMVPENVHAELAKKIPTRELNQKFIPYQQSGRFECYDCGDMVYPGSSCWETGLTH